jgi:hypothetical protein
MIAGRPARTRVEVVPTQEVSDSLAEHTINSTCPKSTFHIGLHLRLDVSPVLHSIQIVCTTYAAGKYENIYMEFIDV